MSRYELNIDSHLDRFSVLYIIIIIGRRYYCVYIVYNADGRLLFNSKRLASGPRVDSMGAEEQSPPRLRNTRNHLSEIVDNRFPPSLSPIIYVQYILLSFCSTRRLSPTLRLPWRRADEETFRPPREYIYIIYTIII